MGTSRTPNGEGEPAQAAGAQPKLGSGSETVVLATFANRHAAERMLTSLGRDFRQKARKSEVAAFLVTGNADGSFSLAQSRVLTASGIAAAGVGVTVATLAGLAGMISALKGGKTVVHAASKRQRHVGADAQRLRDILAEAGPHASVAVVRCADQADGAAVVTQAAARALDSWHGSRDEFITAVNQAVGEHDWVLGAFDEPSTAGG